MQVERTLVKSPPELWAEVSDDDALARRLAGFGAITITRVEPESKVAWEGEHASGTVELTAAGWGTKVVLTAERAVAAPPAAEPKPERRGLRALLLRRRRARARPGPEPEPEPERPDPETVLTAVLDELGAAHHRPFSRS